LTFSLNYGALIFKIKKSFNDHLVTLQENKKYEVLETIKIEETLTFPIDEDQEYQRNMDEVSSHDNFDEGLSTQEEMIWCLDELIELFNKGTRVIDILFSNFQRNSSYELGLEINIKIEANTSLLELIKKQEYLTLE